VSFNNFSMGPETPCEILVSEESSHYHISQSKEPVDPVPQASLSSKGKKNLVQYLMRVPEQGTNYLLSNNTPREGEDSE
jgi:hypothetical protein